MVGGTGPVVWEVFVCLFGESVCKGAGGYHVGYLLWGVLGCIWVYWVEVKGCR